MLDIKAKINEVVEKAKNDPAFMDQLKTDPIKAVEGLLGVDLPDEAIKGIVEGAKAKLTGDRLSGLLGKLGK